MTLAEAGEVFGYWERHPPTYQLVAVIARMLGWQPRPAERPGGGTSPADALANPPPGVAIGRRGDIGMPAPVLDIEEFRERNRARMVEIARRNAASGA